MKEGEKLPARQQLRVRTAVAGLPATDHTLEMETGLPAALSLSLLCDLGKVLVCGHGFGETKQKPKTVSFGLKVKAWCL